MIHLGQGKYGKARYVGAKLHLGICLATWLFRDYDRFSYREKKSVGRPIGGLLSPEDRQKRYHLVRTYDRVLRYIDNTDDIERIRMLANRAEGLMIQITAVGGLLNRKLSRRSSVTRERIILKLRKVGMYDGR